MYIRTTTRRNRDGTVVRYLQLAHNERDPQTGMPRARVLYNFGRADAVDREALARLVRSVSRFLSPEEALHAQATADGTVPLRFIESRPLGGAWVLDQLWLRIPSNPNTHSRVSPNGRSAKSRSLSPAKAITTGAQRQDAASETPHLLPAWYS